MKQTILATGATGLVGSRFVELFSNKYDVVNMDLTTGVDITKVETFTPLIEAHPAAKFLIHLAAFTDTARAEAESGDKNGVCYRVNVGGTKNIADTCKEHGIHLIHVSTDFVFDGSNSPVGGYLEESPLSPIGWYGETKAMAEQVVQDSGASFTILRLSYPYRAKFSAKLDLIQKIKAGLEAGSLPPQFTDSVITPTFIDDIARAFDKIITLKPQGILHTVGSTAISPYDLAKKVAVAYGLDPALVKEGSLAKYLETSARPFAKTMSMSNAKATKVLGLHFATIDEGLSAITREAQ